jgi:uncharacterized membrane protein
MVISIFFRFWRIVASLLLTVVLLFCYTNLPESIAYRFDTAGKPSHFIDKQTFFYFSAGLLFFLNILVLLLKSALIKLDFSKINAQLSWPKYPEQLRAQIKGSFDAFLALLNTYFIFVLTGLNNINGRRDQSLDFDYSLLTVVGSILLIILVFYLPLRLLFTEPRAES